MSYFNKSRKRYNRRLLSTNFFLHYFGDKSALTWYGIKPVNSLIKKIVL